MATKINYTDVLTKYVWYPTLIMGGIVLSMYAKPYYESYIPKVR